MSLTPWRFTYALTAPPLNLKGRLAAVVSGGPPAGKGPHRTRRVAALWCTACKEQYYHHYYYYY